MPGPPSHSAGHLSETNVFLSGSGPYIVGHRIARVGSGRGPPQRRPAEGRQPSPILGPRPALWRNTPCSVRAWPPSRPSPSSFSRGSPWLPALPRPSSGSRTGRIGRTATAPRGSGATSSPRPAPWTFASSSSTAPSRITWWDGTRCPPSWCSRTSPWSPSPARPPRWPWRPRAASRTGWRWRCGPPSSGTKPSSPPRPWWAPCLPPVWGTWRPTSWRGSTTGGRSGDTSRRGWPSPRGR
jgi:hypothetical protein